MDKKSNDNNRIIPVIISILVILAIAGGVWLIVRGNGTKSDEADNGQTSTASEESSVSVTAAELAESNITDTVAFGDYTAMFTLSKAIQNGQKVGAIVSVEGLVSHLMSSYSVIQENPKKEEENELSSVGTVFSIEDGDDADYPDDEQRIKIIAKVVETSPLNFRLVTLKDFIKVVE